MKAKVLVLFYSAYGHIYRMAEAVAEGARQVEGVEVDIKQVPETLPQELREKIGVAEAQKEFAHIPVASVDDLLEYDAIIFGAPTRYGVMASQMKAFLDGTGGIWSTGGLVDKIGSVFTSTGTQHGGQEATILSFHAVLLHHGMLIAGLPYTFEGQSRIDEITGGSPYGASTIAASDGSRYPSENELDGARYQGRRVARLAAKMAK
ncbi:MAG: NAD(P)H:quinone oxidoreductase [Caldicoprobacterales bacterium]|jgi:NAD(P)H dehydrogenase (quinone)|nr:NAD(P)H:quinone oxidoreductase [Clostridiales bacterium]